MRGLIFLPVQGLGLGQEFTEYPPHITLAPPFWLDDEKLPDLQQDLAGVAEDWLPTSVHVDGFDYLGKHKDIQVRRISGFIFGLHAGSIEAVKRQDGVFDTSHTGVDSWNAHISDYEDLAEGDVIEIDQLVLATSKLGIKRVTGIFTSDGYEVLDV